MREFHEEEEEEEEEEKEDTLLHKDKDLSTSRLFYKCVTNDKNSNTKKKKKFLSGPSEPLSPQGVHRFTKSVKGTARLPSH